MVHELSGSSGSRPLAGQLVGVTRMAGQGSALADGLRAVGADVIEAPTIALAGLDDYARVDEALLHLARYDWLVVTSANGVDALFSRLAALGLESGSLAAVKVASVGRATADRLDGYGRPADLVPDEAVGEALAEAIGEEGVAGKRVLLLRADIARGTLPAALSEAGAECDDLPIYRTVRPEALPEAFLDRFSAGAIDWVTLTSPSSLAGLRALLPDELVPRLGDVRLASIGPVTTRAIEAAGLTAAVEADPHDVPGLIEAMCRYRIEGG